MKFNEPCPKLVFKASRLLYEDNFAQVLIAACESEVNDLLEGQSRYSCLCEFYSIIFFVNMTKLDLEKSVQTSLFISKY